MKKNTLTIVVTALLSILLFFISLTFSGELVEFLIPQMEHVEYQITDIGHLFWMEFFISVSFGLLPISIVLVCWAAKITTAGKKAGVASTIIGCSLLSLFARRIILLIIFNDIQSPFPEVNIRYPYNDLNFGGYMLGGLITGCVVAFFIFRDTKSASQSL